MSRITNNYLLSDCQRLVRLLEDDLRERLAEHPDLDAPVRAEYERARQGRRTGQTYNAWRDEYLTQVAVHWVLAAVFIRFLEDNYLLQEPRLSGPGPRFDQARDCHAQFFVREPAASDREYLLASFRELESQPATAPLFDERHNPLFRLGPSADGARAIIDLFRKVDPATGALVHDFTDETWQTRFLGDLYQDLSESARKRFALLQTPEFVEEFLLDRTLEPAIAEVGFQKVTLIDPACGSGHFILGSFRRIFDRWQQAEPGTNPRELARRALDQIAGVDVNPFAVAIARFRLLIAALRVSGIRRLADAPAFPLHLAAGDSLLHGERLLATRGIQIPLVGEDCLAHVYNTEDAEALRRILGHKYTVVVGNPPYITPKDPAENEAYRDRFGSCHRQYSMAVPFMERYFDLASRSPAGWVGMITANSFMKREFGKKLIEQYIPRWDLTHVIDTSGASIPGHEGTPTVILFGRQRPPVSATIRAVLGIRGEPGKPEKAEVGLVWKAITRQLDAPGSRSDFVSTTDTPREQFYRHPWSTGGGGAADLKIALEATKGVLGEEIAAIGRTMHTGSDESYIAPPGSWQRQSLPEATLIPVVEGEAIRDWRLSALAECIFPYDSVLRAMLPESSATLRTLWVTKQILTRRREPNGTHEEIGLTWFEWSRFQRERFMNPLSLGFAFVATHNHFALDRGGKVFKQTAPAIKLPVDSPEEAHLALLGLLNSSTACFWLKQVMIGKHKGDGGEAHADPANQRFEFDSTKLQQLPLPSERPIALATSLDQLARKFAEGLPLERLKTSLPTRTALAEAQTRADVLARRMIALQEELDWQVYRLYGLLEEPLEADPAEVPEVALGERPFEIVLARKMAAGEIETKWFERHNSTPITEIPTRWPEPYRCLVEKRIQAIAENPWIALIEQPEYKRRWNCEPWEGQEQRALRNWLLDRLEDHRHWPDPPTPISTARLADRLRQDDEFRQVAALYRGRDDFDWTELVTELALDEAIPFLAAHRYADSGLRKRADWEETWRLQRLEDEGKFDGKDIPVPPRYASADFRKPSYWRLRGKLDVPKERFIHYPGLERGADPTPVIGWAGWNHLEQAQALGTAFHELREREGWGRDQLAPVLAGLLELLPWVRQWHNEPDPAHGGSRLGDFFSGFLDEEARLLGLTRDDLASWRPATRAVRGRRRGSS